MPKKSARPNKTARKTTSKPKKTSRRSAAASESLLTREFFGHEQREFHKNHPNAELLLMVGLTAALLFVVTYLYSM